MTEECVHERDVIEAVASGHWPTAIEPELRTHLSGCDSCSEIADLAAMLHHDHDALCRDVQIPSAAQIWRSAAIRTRIEAQHAAAQPILVTERVAAACATGIVFAAFTWIAPARVWAAVVTHAATRLAESCSDLTIASSAALNSALPLVMGLTACAIVVPVALHFLLVDD